MNPKQIPYHPRKSGKNRYIQDNQWLESTVAVRSCPPMHENIALQQQNSRAHEPQFDRLLACCAQTGPMIGKDWLHAYGEKTPICALNSLQTAEMACLNAKKGAIPANGTLFRLHRRAGGLCERRRLISIQPMQPRNWALP